MDERSDAAQAAEGHDLPDPVASAGRVAPVPVAQRNPGLGVTFTNPAANILSTPTFTLATRLRAQWSSDSTAKSYDVIDR